MAAIFIDCNETKGNTLHDRGNDIVLSPCEYKEIKPEESLEAFTNLNVNPKDYSEVLKMMAENSIRGYAVQYPGWVSLK